MKILMLSSLYPPIGRGGAEKAVSLLSEALASYGHEIVVVSLHPGRSESVEHQNGVKIYRLPMDNGAWPFNQLEKPNAVSRGLWHLRDIWNTRAAARIARILDIEKPDVVHSHVIAGFSIAAWKQIKKRNIRLVHTMHDYYLLCVRSSLFRDGRTCSRRCAECVATRINHKSWSNRLDHTVAVSTSVRETHRRSGYLVNVPTSVIYNISPTPAATEVSEVLPTRSELRFGFIGKLEDPKGIKVLLEATRLIRNNNWRLRIAGRGLSDYVNALKQEFGDKRIEWLGFVDSDRFYESVDVIVVPSTWAEPSAYVIVETLLAGRGLICSDSGGSPELASLGRMTKTFKAGDAQSLAEVVDHAIDHAEEWKRGGLADGIANPFSEDHVVARHLEVYTGELDGSS